MISWKDFEKVDIRVGRVIKVEDFPEARNPSYKLTIDFGSEIGVKKSAGQFVGAYPDKKEMKGRLVLAVVNFPPKQIGPFKSECLTLGLQDDENNWVLVNPDRKVPLGGKLR
jgi:tRNA-binding protein